MRQSAAKLEYIKPGERLKVKILYQEALNFEIVRYILTKPWSFQAGQYTKIHFNNKLYPFSIASSPLTKTLELHIQNSPRHPLDRNFADFLTRTDHFDLAPPQGTAILSEADSPLLMVGGGSGFSQLKSIIEMTLTTQNRSILLYWGVRTPASLYLLDMIKTWQQEPRFKFIPVISDINIAGYRGGLVHEAILADYQDLSPFEIYLAGPFEMSLIAREAFMRKGAKTFISDALNNAT